MAVIDVLSTTGEEEDEKREMRARGGLQHPLDEQHEDPLRGFIKEHDVLDVLLLVLAFNGSTKNELNEVDHLRAVFVLHQKLCNSQVVVVLV